MSHGRRIGFGVFWGITVAAALVAGAASRTGPWGNAHAAERRATAQPVSDEVARHRAHEAQFLIREVLALKRGASEAETRWAARAQALRQLDEALRAAQARLDEAEETAAHHAREVRMATQQVADLTRALEAQQRAKARADEAVQAAEQRQVDAQATVSESQRTIAELRRQMETARQELAQVQAALTAQDREGREWREAAAAAQTSMKDLQSRLRELEGAQADAATEVARWAQVVSDAQRDLAASQDQARLAEQARVAAQQDAERWRQEVQLRDDELRRVTASFVEAKASISEAQAAQTSATQEAQQARHEAAQARAQLAPVESERDSLIQERDAQQAAMTRLQQVVQEERARVQTLTAELGAREDRLHQIRALAPLTPAPITAVIPAAPLVESPSPAAAAPLPPVSSAKIYRVNEEHGFLVLSAETLPGAVPGSSFLLSQGETPVAEVELSEVDAGGIAIGYITRKLNPHLAIRTGEVLAARPLVRVSTATLADREE